MESSNWIVMILKYSIMHILINWYNHGADSIPLTVLIITLKKNIISSIHVAHVTSYPSLCFITIVSASLP